MVLGRALRDDVGPFTLAAARFTIASGIYLILLQRQTREARRLGKDRWALLAMAVSVAAFSPLLYLGLRFTSVVNATLINALGPLITGLLAALLIHEPMSRRQVTGALVGLAGVIFLISFGASAVGEPMTVNRGDLVTVAAVTMWSLYSVFGRKVMHHRSALSATALSTWLGLIFLLPAAAWELQAFPMEMRPASLLAVLYIGVMPTVIGYFSWNAGVRRLGASGAMVFYNTLPLYGALLGFLLLGESIGPTHILGGVLVISGGLWASRRNT
jgi:drug/metabolite transporter (DMT)-like permease